MLIKSYRCMLKGVAALLAITLTVSLCTPACSHEETTVDVESRPGHTVRVLVLRAEHAIGSVILLAGGHGNLSLTADGKIGWGGANQLVRTRAAYAKAGYLTLVPDVATDLKVRRDVVLRYRWSPEHAEDIGRLVQYARSLSAPVYLVGTSRAALSVVNAAVHLSGYFRPDALVITSGMLSHVDESQPSVERNVSNLERITQRAPTRLPHRDIALGLFSCARPALIRGTIQGSTRSAKRIVIVSSRAHCAIRGTRIGLGASARG